MTWTFDLRPQSFHQVVSLSWTIDQRNVRTEREIAEYAFSDIFRSFPFHGLSTSKMCERTETSLNMHFQTFLGMMKLVPNRVK